jgi:triphosphatase
MSDQPVEIELTLRVDHTAAVKLLRDPGIRSLMVGKVAQRRLFSTYFDTPDHKLRDDGIALRIRRVGRARVQTVKVSNPRISGLLTRIEDEFPVASDRPDVSVIRDHAIAKRLSRKRIAAQLAPMFSTDFVRKSVVLRLGADEVELALDRGKIIAGDRLDSICEIEIELRSGGVASVYELGLRLAGIIDVTIEPRSKAERGYALLTNQPIEAARAEQIELEKSAPFGEAIRRIGRSCAIQIRRNLLVARLARSDEAIHQLRVGLRRARTMISIFKLLEKDTESAGFVDGLKGLMSDLAPARDWDVFRAEVVPHLSRVIGDARAYQRFVELIDRQRAAAHERAAAAIGGSAATQTVLQFEAWIEGGGAWSALGAEADRPAQSVACEILQSLAKKVNKLLDDIVEAEDKRIHYLRLRAKRLRYGAEFFADLFPGKGTKTYLRGLAALQDHLGAFNDGVVGASLVAPLHADHVVLARAIGAAAGWCGAIAQRERVDIPAALATFQEQEPFWR